MPSRRSLIQMSTAEARAFLAEQRVANVATTGPNSRPHLAPLWYVPRDDPGAPLAFETWTFAKSQKTMNLLRLALATVLFEAGESYETLRGLSLECDVTLIDGGDDTERVAAIGYELAVRYAPQGAEADEQLRDAVRAQAAKRVGLVFTPTKIVSWDHSKLGGGY